MERATPDRIVLLGMMGAGKSSVGAALSRRTGWPYLDNDRLVRETTGRAPEVIDAQDGEAALHAAESAALHAALARPGPMIVGAAAMVVDDSASVARLRALPGVVYLRARAETLRSRIGSGAGRRDEAVEPGWLEARLARRDARYRDLAALTIETDQRTTTEVVDRIGQRWPELAVRP
jgi:shikimate kinase